MSAEKNGQSWVPLDVGIRHHLRTLSGAAVAVYVALKSRFNTSTGQLNPSIETIAADTGLTPTSVKVALIGLRKKGLVSSVRTGRSSRYVLAPIAADGQVIRPSDSPESRLSADAEQPDSPESGPSDSPESRPSDSRETGPQTTTSKLQPINQKEDAPLRSAAASPPAGCAGFSPVGEDPNAERGTASAPPATSPPPAPPTQVQAKRKPKATAKRPPLSDAERERICSAVGHMELFLLWGRDALEEGADTAGLTPEQTNWRTTLKLDGEKLVSVGYETWTVPQFMGYYWFRVCRHRAQRQIPLTLPLWSRLAGDVKNLRATMTAKEFYNLIGTLCQHFDLIRFRLRNAGATIALNETSLMNSMIRGDASNLAAMAEDQIEAEYRRMNEAYGNQAA